MQPVNFNDECKSNCQISHEDEKDPYQKVTILSPSNGSSIDESITKLRGLGMKKLELEAEQTKLARKPSNEETDQKKIEVLSKSLTSTVKTIESIEELLVIQLATFTDGIPLISSFKPSFKYLKSIEDLDLYVNIYRNRVRNSIEFHRSVKQFLSDKKVQISSIFFPKISTRNIDFSITPLEGDPHLRGRAPLLLTLKKGETLRDEKVVLKPRSAELDKALMDLFKMLNEASPKAPKLGMCKIVSYPEQHFSIWEYVDGFHPGSLNLGLYLEELSLNSNPAPRRSIFSFKQKDDSKQLNEGAARLEQVSLELGLSDLHAGNVLIKKGGGQKAKIVPIDLEVLSPRGLKSPRRQSTNLFDGVDQRPVEKALSTEEFQLIEGFKKKHENTPSRFLILSTAELVDAMTSMKNIDNLCIKLGENLKENFNLTRPQNLKKEILAVVEQGDICYFSLEGPILYLLKSPEEKVEIARLKPENDRLKK